LKKSDKDFLWRVCNQGILKNIYSNSLTIPHCVPVQDAGGDISYLGKQYRLKEIIIDNNF
jgi:uncharacterized protein YwbE